MILAYLHKLRVLPPQGAPLWHRVHGFGFYIEPTNPHASFIAESCGQNRWGCPWTSEGSQDLALLLDAPPVPRTDGAVVAAWMIAEAGGLDTSAGVTFSLEPSAQGATLHLRTSVSRDGDVGNRLSYSAKDYPTLVGLDGSRDLDRRMAVRVVLLAALGVTA